jgi:hypothetical protein
MGMTLDDELEFLDLDELRSCATCGNPFCSGCEAPDRRREADALQSHAARLRAESAGLTRFVRCKWLTVALRCELQARRLVRPMKIDNGDA